MYWIGALLVLASVPTQESSDARALLQQVHAAHQILGEPLSALEAVLEGARAEWDKAKEAGWASEPDGIGEAAIELAWMAELVRDPVPGQRDRLKVDLADVARFLLLARAELPPEAAVLRARCQDVEILLKRLQAKKSIASESVQRYEDWRRTLTQVEIEVPQPGAEEWTGELKARVPAGSPVEIWLLGSHVELTVNDGEVKQRRYEEELYPQRGVWQAVALVGRNERGKAMSASSLVWVKASNEDRTLEDVQRLVEESRREEDAAPPVDPTVVIDGEIPRAVIEGCDWLEGSMPEVHVGEGYAWGPPGREKLYPWRISHRKTGIVLVLVRPGTFWMGSPEDERWWDEEVLHQVEITRPFYLAETEVTQLQYELIIGKNPSRFKERKNPVEQISWVEALEFCRKIGFALPTEAQWEYACRAGMQTPFSFGENLSKDQACYGRSEEAGPIPVRTFAPNAWGFYNMHGNVSEWCLDGYDKRFYQQAWYQDPVFPPESSLWRVFRGGHYACDALIARAAMRRDTEPSFKGAWIGLRPAKNIGLNELPSNAATLGGDVVSEGADERALPEGFELLSSRDGSVPSHWLGPGYTWKARILPWRIRHIESGVALLLVPPGSFWMGSPESEEGRNSSAETLHQVELTAPFYLGETEVTQAQYERIVGAKPGKAKEPNLPVHNIDWADATEFCRRIGCELPTEAQWEYACRAGTQTPYSFGETLSRGQACFGRSLDAGPVAVRSFAPNAWGFYDMHGNVSEYCRDGFNAMYKAVYARFGWYEEESLEDQFARLLDKAMQDLRGITKDPVAPMWNYGWTVKGGSFFDERSYARSASRSFNLDRTPIGFRVARRIVF